jgi:hypothetical protein
MPTIPLGVGRAKEWVSSAGTIDATHSKGKDGGSVGSAASVAFSRWKAAWVALPEIEFLIRAVLNCDFGTVGLPIRMMPGGAFRFQGGLAAFIDVGIILFDDENTVLCHFPLHIDDEILDTTIQVRREPGLYLKIGL